MTSILQRKIHISDLTFSLKRPCIFFAFNMVHWSSVPAHHAHLGRLLQGKSTLTVESHYMVFWPLQPCGILAPQPWIEPGPFAMGALSPTHWTTWNSPKLFLIPQPNVTFSLTSQSSYLKLPTVFSLLFPSFTKWWNKYRTAEHSHNEPHRITTTFSNLINLLYFLMSTTLKTQRNPLHMPSWSPSSFLRGNL